ncbi:hypothetical protein H4582DRAFT_2054033 [Lactarius indigo]|nr:hypothetical protein H4582DRAFT_2054033 [Lactarius indigo]
MSRLLDFEKKGRVGESWGGATAFDFVEGKNVSDTYRGRDARIPAVKIADIWARRGDDVECCATPLRPRDPTRLDCNETPNKDEQGACIGRLEVWRTNMWGQAGQVPGMPVGG